MSKTKNSKIAIIYSSDAEYSLLKPLLDTKLFVECNLANHIQDVERDYSLLGQVYTFIYNWLQKESISKVVVLGDRKEITMASMATFLLNIPIVQLAAGDLSKSLGTDDDIFRHCVTLMSDCQIAFSKESKNVVDQLCAVINKVSKSYVSSNLSFVGIDIAFIKSVRMIDEPYIFIFVHPEREESLINETIKNIAEQLRSVEESKKIVVIFGNKDKNYELLTEKLKDVLHPYEDRVIIVPRLPKKSFLSLMSNCDLFVTNSSCSAYETPALLKKEQIVIVGERNRGRNIGDINLNNDINDILEKIYE